MKKPMHSRIHFSSTVLSAAASILLATPSAFALTYYWDNNGTASLFGTAGGTWAAPTTGDATQGWSQDATGVTEPVSVTTTSSDIVNFGSATATSLLTGTITVSGTVDAGTVNFGSGAGAITLSGGTISLGGSRTITSLNNGNVIGSAIQLGVGNGTISSNQTSGASTLSINGQISGTGNMTFTTPNASSGGTLQTINLGAAATYTGNTTITTGNLNNATSIKNTSGAANVLPISTVLTLNGGSGTGSGRAVTFDLNGQNQELAGLTNTSPVPADRNQRVTSTAAATLTINNSADFAFGGATKDSATGTNSGTTTRAQITGAISLVKKGVGTFSLGGTQTNSPAAGGHPYTGTTTVNAGKLIGVVGEHHSSSDVTVDNTAATYGVSVTDNTKSWTCKSLAYTAAGTLEFNFGAITPSTTTSPLIVTNAADFTAATPQVSVVLTSNIPAGTYPLMTCGSITGTAPTTANLTVSMLGFGKVADLQVSGNVLNLVITSNINYIVKDDNLISLDSGSSWVGNTAPTATDIAKWNSTVNSPNSTVLGADATWAGMVIENPNGLVTIGGSNILTLGAADIDIDLSSAHTASLTLNCPLSLGGDNVWDVATGRTLTIGGGVSGNFPITLQGSGTVRLGAGNVLPDGAGNGNVVANGTLDLNGQSDAINGLSGSGTVDNTAASTSSTLTVGGNDQSGTFSGILQNTGTSAILNLAKTGTGTLALSAANSLSGTVSIAGGKLAFSNAAPFDYASGISISDGTVLESRVNGAAIISSAPINLAGGTGTITAPLTGSTGGAVYNLDINSQISGAGGLTFLGVQAFNTFGTVNLNAANNYSGDTLLTTDANESNKNIFVNLGVDNALPVTTVLTLDGQDGAVGATGAGRGAVVNLNDCNQTLAGLTNIPRTKRYQRIYNTGANEKVLTINNSADYTFSGNLGTTVANGNFALTKSGTGTFTLSGTNAYTGATNVNGGKLFINGDQTAAAGTVAVSGGATLGGTGTIGGNTTIADTGKLEFNISTNAAGHNKLDLAATKTLTFSGSSVLKITSTSGAALGQYTLVTAPGGITGTAPTPDLPAGWAATVSIVGGTDLVLDVTVVTVDYYADWAGGSLFTDDANGDGVDNGLAWILGAADKNVSALNKLPTVATSGGFLTLDFTRVNPYSPAKLYVEYGTNLTGWTKLEIPVLATGIHALGNGVEAVVTSPGSPTPDTIQVKIPTSLDGGGGKLFTRLSATQN